MVFIQYFNETLLHLACESGNLDLVKYLISLNEINLNEKDILISLFSNNIFKKSDIYQITNI